MNESLALHKKEFWVIICAVTITEKAQIALELLRDNKNKFNLGISYVDMPDMDGFELLELLGLEMDLHIIRMFLFNSFHVS